jgi:hypothetical protein
VAEALVEGTWVARWGAWEISIRGRPGSWMVGVSPTGKRNVFATASAAVGWACTVLRQQGAVAFIDGRKRRLEEFLAFERLG